MGKKIHGSTSTKTEFSAFEQAIVDGLRAGKSLSGPEGVLSELIGFVVTKAMDAELGDHLQEEAAKLAAARQAGQSAEPPGKNKRNGRQSKTVRTDFGPALIQPSRDRNGTYESDIVGKWQRDLAPNMSQHILSLYARGNSQQDISDHLFGLFGQHISKASISRVVDEVWPDVVQWQQRPLRPCYVAVFLDAIHHKVRLEGRSTSVATYVFYGVDVQGDRDILSVHTGQGAESASTWSVLMEELKERGVEDVLVFVSDGLPGMQQVIEHHFPASDQQRCIVHKVRNSMVGIPYKKRREVAADLRTIYTARDEASALLALEAVEAKWPQYPHLGRSWRQDWTELMHFMEYGPEMRRLIYTTNALENVNRNIRKGTKTKGSWPTQRSLSIQIYLLLQIGRKSWDRKVYRFSAVQTEVIERHGDRYLKWITE